MRQLNLGCGSNIRDGYEHYDMYPVDGRVEHLDLNCLPLPFKTSSIDHVLLRHVLEHLDVNVYRFMVEIHRILQRGGVVEVFVPHRDNPSSCNIAHTSLFTERSMQPVVTKREYSMQTNHLFDIDELFVKRRIPSPFGYLSFLNLGVKHEVYWRLRKR